MNDLTCSRGHWLYYRYDHTNGCRLTNHLFRPQADCTHLMYDAESKSYEWTSDYGVLLDGSCSICLEVFDANDPVVSGKCGHPYHYECIVGWMQIKNECPYCRHPMWSKHTYENVKADIKGKTMILPDDDEEGSGRSYTINASSQSSLSE